MKTIPSTIALVFQRVSEIAEALQPIGHFLPELFAFTIGSEPGIAGFDQEATQLR